MGVVRVDIPDPAMGAKGWLLDSKGIYLLEEGPGMIRGIACTHAGTGVLTIYDGVPDDRGFFPPLPPTETPEYGRACGRPIYKSNPVVMGMWMLDLGFQHGLTVVADGGHDAAAAIATITWLRHREVVSELVSGD